MKNPIIISPELTRIETEMKRLFNLEKITPVVINEYNHLEAEYKNLTGYKERTKSPVVERISKNGLLYKP